MSDLIERLMKRRMSRTGETEMICSEAAAALRAKDAEIERLHKVVALKDVEIERSVVCIAELRFDLKDERQRSRKAHIAGLREAAGIVVHEIPDCGMLPEQRFARQKRDEILARADALEKERIEHG